MFKFLKGISAFSLGMFVGVCYGAIIASITAFAMLG
jgi:hypothetical protein